jgi:hypothetical protein
MEIKDIREEMDRVARLVGGKACEKDGPGLGLKLGVAGDCEERRGDW